MERQWETLKEYKEIKYEFLKGLQKLQLTVHMYITHLHLILYKK